MTCIAVLSRVRPIVRHRDRFAQSDERSDIWRRDPRYAVRTCCYYSGTKGNTVVDTQQLDENANKLREFCYVHKQTPVMDAAEAVFGVKR